MKAADYFRPPVLTKGFLRVWQRDFLFYRKTWMVQMMWTVLEPLMYLGAIGYGLGSYVSGMDGHSYVEFFFPGIVCTTAMTVAFFEGTYGNFTKLTWQKTYQTIMLTRISPEEIAVGEILWTTSKGMFGAVGVVAVASFFGLVDTWRIIPSFAVLVLTSWLFSALAMIVTTIVKNYDHFIYFTSGFIIPMSLISGVYFPVEQLPVGLKQFAWLLPLTHSVGAVRETLNGTSVSGPLMHSFVLFAAAWIATNVAVHRVRAKLIR